ncbi:MAG: 2Fe-2S iron-sulfur cluster-binding protein [Treponema sp.]|nr:2Fe-2S iron-sulfur cluster-binding protein [Treponema sp.]
MTIGFILNGENVTVQAAAATRLVDVLRGTLRLPGTRAGCCAGTCGACSVIFNGEVVKSCLVPAFKLRDSEIVTIEGFSQTDDYQDIIHGFAEAKAECCGFCDAGKILTIEALLNRNHRPQREEIIAGLNGIKCRCTDPEGLVQAVMAAVEHRRKRLYGYS